MIRPLIPTTTTETILPTRKPDLLSMWFRFCHHRHHYHHHHRPVHSTVNVIRFALFTNVQKLNRYRCGATSLRRHCYHSRRQNTNHEAHLANILSLLRHPLVCHPKTTTRQHPVWQRPQRLRSESNPCKHRHRKSDAQQQHQQPQQQQQPFRRILMRL